MNLRTLKLRKVRRSRTAVQAITAVLQNSWFAGFIRGRVWSGSSKAVCVPGLNCYSCPGAWGSCPIGSLQAVLDGTKSRVSLYVSGFIALFGVGFGRAICGWVCPFGLIQELLYRIHSHKVHIGPTRLRYLKYAILVVLVILMPMLIRDSYGVGDPWFCKLVCPAGTLEAALPLMAVDASLRGAAGWLFLWKLSLLAGTVAASVVIYRPFCRFVCPLGAVYGVFNPVSVVQLSLDKTKCTHCGMCAAVCKMGVDPSVNPTSAECIRCGDCVAVCPEDALALGLPAGRRKVCARSAGNGKVPS